MMGVGLFFCLTSCQIAPSAVREEDAVESQVESMYEDTTHSKTSEERILDATMDELISAIKARDKEAFKKQLSAITIKKAENLDESIDAFIYFCQGKIVSYEATEGYYMEIYPEFWGEQRVVKGFYTVKSHGTIFDPEQDNYYKIGVIIVALDFMHPENEGIYSLQILRGCGTLGFDDFRRKPVIWSGYQEF